MKKSKWNTRGLMIAIYAKICRLCGVKGDPDTASLDEQSQKLVRLVRNLDRKLDRVLDRPTNVGAGNDNAGKNWAETGYRGAAYFASCLIDELMERHYPNTWPRLERLFQSSTRSTRYFEQIELVKTVDGAMAAMLPLLLGFQGELRDNPGRLEEVFESLRSRLELRQDVPEARIDFAEDLPVRPLWSRRGLFSRFLPTFFAGSRHGSEIQRHFGVANCWLRKNGTDIADERLKVYIVLGEPMAGFESFLGPTFEYAPKRTDSEVRLWKRGPTLLITARAGRLAWLSHQLRGLALGPQEPVAGTIRGWQNSPALEATFVGDGPRPQPLKPDGTGTADYWDNRLRDVLRCLNRFRPARPIDGAVVLVNERSLAGSGAARVAQAAHIDLQAAKKILGITYPVVPVAVDLETIPGAAEFLRRLPDDLRNRRLGQGAVTAGKGALDEFFDRDLPGLTLSVMSPSQNNDEVFRFWSRTDAKQNNYQRVVDAVTAAGLSLGGFFWSATGSKQHQRAFADGIFEKLDQLPVQVQWTAEAIELDRELKVVAMFGSLGSAALLGALVVALGWLF